MKISKITPDLCQFFTLDKAKTACHIAMIVCLGVIVVWVFLGNADKNLVPLSYRLVNAQGEYATALGSAEATNNLIEYIDKTIEQHRQGEVKNYQYHLGAISFLTKTKENLQKDLKKNKLEKTKAKEKGARKRKEINIKKKTLTSLEKKNTI